jgi:hypothetical protein
LITVIRPFIDLYGYRGIAETFLFIYLGSFLFISALFYFVYYRPTLDPMPLRTPLRETHRTAIRFSLTVLFIWLVWTDRLWALLSDLVGWGRTLFF